jgi:predicted permease
MSLETLIEIYYIYFVVLIIVVAIWDGIWKLFAMWRACKRDSKLWFILIAVFNTLGVMPILYLIFTREEN